MLIWRTQKWQENAFTGKCTDKSRNNPIKEAQPICVCSVFRKAMSVSERICGKKRLVVHKNKMLKKKKKKHLQLLQIATLITFKACCFIDRGHKRDSTVCILCSMCISLVKTKRCLQIYIHTFTFTFAKMNPSCVYATESTRLIEPAA